MSADVRLSTVEQLQLENTIRDLRLLERALRLAGGSCETRLALVNVVSAECDVIHKLTRRIETVLYAAQFRAEIHNV